MGGPSSFASTIAVPTRNDRIIDLSRRSAEVLGFRGNGTALVRVKFLGRAPLNGDDHYEQRFLASQSFMQVAANGKSRKASAPAVASLPAENPENLQTPWKEAAPAQAAAAPAPTQQDAAAYNGFTTLSPPKEAKAVAFDAPLYWQASPRTAERPQVAATGSLPPSRPATASISDGLVVQAGSFKSRDNADKARTTLAAIAPVEVAEIEAGGNIYFRVQSWPVCRPNGGRCRPGQGE